MSNKRKGRGAPQRPKGGDQDKPKILVFRGQSFRLPDSADDWDLETAEAYERGQFTVAMAGIVGSEAWSQIKSMGAKVRDLNEIADQVARLYGFESMGESSASSD